VEVPIQGKDFVELGKIINEILEIILKCRYPKPRRRCPDCCYKNLCERTIRKILMNPKDYMVAKELKEKLSKVTSLVDLIVFGSRARGNQDEFSDLDISIIVPSLNTELKERIYEIAWEVGFENYVVISPLVFTEDEIENSALRSAPIVKNILEEGVRV
jgi:predicted nucleotidyltransferase